MTNSPIMAERSKVRNSIGRFWTRLLSLAAVMGRACLVR
jgi:hypothetical protein